MRWQDGREVNREWTIDRNSMFLELMRDFMDLAEGREPQENPLLPRLDLVMESSALIAQGPGRRGSFMARSIGATNDRRARWSQKGIEGRDRKELP